MEAQVGTRPDGPGNSIGENPLVVVHHGSTHKVSVRWNVPNFGSKNQQKMLYSKYFEVGGYDCRLLVYPTGDAQALPGYLSVYLQISDPSSSSSKWDCFASYRLSVANIADESKSIHRDSWHRFSAKKRSHGWCDFAALSAVLDPKQGFLAAGDTVCIATDITILHESVTFTRESDLGGGPPTAGGDVFSGKCVWKVHNFDSFQPLLKTQKIMSPAFPAGDCALRMSVYQSTVGGEDFLSVCLESKDTDRSSGGAERTCWCLFRLSAVSQKEDGKQIYRDSYGRFAADSRSGDNTSLGWNDFMRVSDFAAENSGYLEDGCAFFSASFHVIRENTSLSRAIEPRFGANAGHSSNRGRLDKRKALPRENDSAGRFTWRIENFTRLKDLLKKRKITGLCIKSRRFTVGGRDCRLIVYPRGQSQPPTYLSLFLEVSDGKLAAPEWTCFVSHRLAVVNQKSLEGDRNVSKESQNRYSRAAKDWGWREFVSLTTLFDADAGFLVNDCVVFSAEVLVLKESTEVMSKPLPKPVNPLPAAAENAENNTTTTSEENTKTTTATDPAIPSSITTFTWRIDNFLAFKDVMETRKIFSKFFSHGPCELRMGLYESFESLCIYLESEAPAAPPAPNSNNANGNTAADAQKPPNYWVRYRVAVLNQRRPEASVWKEGTMLTRSWNNSVLQFPRVAAGDGQGAALLVKEALAVCCEVLECRPCHDGADGEPAIPAASPSLDGVRAALGRLEDDPNAVAASGRMAVSPLTSSDDSENTTDDSSGSSKEIGDGGDDDSADYDDDQDGDSEGYLSDGARDDDGDEHGFEGDGPLSKYLSAAGLELLGLDSHPPLLANDVEEMQQSLEEALKSHPGLAQGIGLDLYTKLSSFVRTKRLLLPCLTANPTTPGSIYGVAPAALTMLMGVPSLRKHVLVAVISAVLQHCHVLRYGPSTPDESSGTASEDDVDVDQEAAEGGEKKNAADGIDSKEEGKDTSAGLQLPTANGDHNALATAESSKETVADDGAPVPDLESLIDGLRLIDVQAEVAAAARASETPTNEEHLLAAALLLGWVRSIDPSLLTPISPKTNKQSSSNATDWSHFPVDGRTALERITFLLDVVPPVLLPDAVLLVPALVEPKDHTAAAGILLAKLADTSRAGVEEEKILRMPVLAALGSLRIDPNVAQTVLTAALDALPNLAASELPPAVGLALKLAASSNEQGRKQAVRAVRNRLRSASSSLSALPESNDDTTVSTTVVKNQQQQKENTGFDGALEAVRLSALQHQEVATALLNDIIQECKQASSDTTTPVVSQADVDFLLDCLSRAGPKRDLAIQALQLAVSNGISPSQLSAQVQQRLSAEASGSDSGGSTGVLSAWFPLPAASICQRAFVAAHPIACPKDECDIVPALAKELRLSLGLASQNKVGDQYNTQALENGNTSSNEAATHQQSSPLPGSEDLLSGVGIACESLLQCDGEAQKAAAASLYLASYRAAGDYGSKQRVLRSLARLSLSDGSPLPHIIPLPHKQQQASDGSKTSQGENDSLVETKHVTEFPAPSANDTPAIIAANLLAFLAAQSADTARDTVALALDEAAAAEIKALQAQTAASAAETRHARELATERSALQRAQQESRKAFEKAAELETQLSRAKAGHHAELANAASDKKELQAKVRTLEQQLDWVKSERDEEKSSRSREIREANQRATEAEVSLNRLKTQRKEEQRKLLKDKSIADTRIREVEEAYELAVRQRNDASQAVSRAEKVAMDSRRRAEAAERAIAERDSEIASLRASVTDRETRLRATVDSARELERRLASEQSRVASLLQGTGLDSMSTSELESFLSVHEQGLMRVRALLAKRGVPSQPPQQPQQQTRSANSSLSNLGSLHGSLTSLGSGGLSTASLGGGLFSGGGWGSTGGGNGTAGTNGAGRAAAVSHHSGGGGAGFGAGLVSSHLAGGTNDGTAGGAGDSDGMLGLLPSDLLHS